MHQHPGELRQFLKHGRRFPQNYIDADLLDSILLDMDDDCHGYDAQKALDQCPRDPSRLHWELLWSPAQKAKWWREKNGTKRKRGM
jgi:hypothetical protein